MSDFQTYLAAVVQSEKTIEEHEKDTVMFLQQAAQEVLEPFKKARGSGTFRLDKSNRSASRKDGFYSGEVACSLPERNGVPSIESRVVMAAKKSEGEAFVVRVNEKEGRAASPADFASLVFDSLIDKVQDDVISALGSETATVA